MALKLIMILAGGGLGALCRHAVAVLAARHVGTGYPWGTLAVNLGGCLLIGLAYGLTERQVWDGHVPRFFFMTGFLGAMTTFSTFGLETVNVARSGGLVAAGANLLAHNAGGLVCVVAGMALARLIR